MSLRRLGLGELLASVSAVVLVVAMFFSWYGRGHRQLDAWSAFTVVEVLLAAAALVALALAVFTVVARRPDLPVAGSVWTTFWGLVATVVILARILFPPTRLPVQGAAWVGLLAAAGILAGGWQAMRDERT